MTLAKIFTLFTYSYFVRSIFVAPIKVEGETRKRGAKQREGPGSSPTPSQRPTASDEGQAWTRGGGREGRSDQALSGAHGGLSRRPQGNKRRQGGTIYNYWNIMCSVSASKEGTILCTSGKEKVRRKHRSEKIERGRK